jgi:hypothetical protein
MKRELEPVAQELPEHDHLFVQVRPHVTRRFRQHFPTIGIDPRRPT